MSRKCRCQSTYEAYKVAVAVAKRMINTDAGSF